MIPETKLQHAGVLFREIEKHTVTGSLQPKRSYILCPPIVKKEDNLMMDFVRCEALHC
jgi:hypothetical protein